jgi:hypothetical protein
MTDPTAFAMPVAKRSRSRAVDRNHGDISFCGGSPDDQRPLMKVAAVAVATVKPARVCELSSESMVTGGLSRIRNLDVPAKPHIVARLATEASSSSYIASGDGICSLDVHRVNGVQTSRWERFYAADCERWR